MFVGHTDYKYLRWQVGEDYEKRRKIVETEIEIEIARERKRERKRSHSLTLLPTRR